MSQRINPLNPVPFWQRMVSYVCWIMALFSVVQHQFGVAGAAVFLGAVCWVGSDAHAGRIDAREATKRLIWLNILLVGYVVVLYFGFHTL